MELTQEQARAACPPLPAADAMPASQAGSIRAGPSADADEAFQYGVIAPELPRALLPIEFPAGPIIMERKPIAPNFSWLPGHSGDE